MQNSVLSSHTVPDKLARCASPLDTWNKSTLKHLRREIGRIRGRITALNKNVNLVSWRAIRFQENKLDNLLAQDEKYWHQRSRTDNLLAQDEKY
ncbi:hypothetical protein ACOSQ4_014866 [Xanthoceras sorbifolium]